MTILNIIVCLVYRRRGVLPPVTNIHQISLDKIINVTIQHLLRVSVFQIRPVIFYHFVGMQNIGANLASPCDVFFFFFLFNRRYISLLQYCVILP